jgi:hypothetical protein
MNIITQERALSVFLVNPLTLTPLRGILTPSIQNCEPFDQTSKVGYNRRLRYEEATEGILQSPYVCLTELRLYRTSLGIKIEEGVY